jgi:AcrR family transcriptional regulator
MAKTLTTVRRTAGKRVGVSREALLQQAADLADREGVAAVTLARLAAMSDVRTPTVSHHVGSLRQLRSDLALLAVEELTEAVRRASTGLRGAEAVRSMYRAYRAFVHAYPGRYAASVEAPDPKDARRLAAAGRLTELLKDVFGQIGLNGEDAMRAARLLRAAVHGYATLELNAAWQTPLDDDATFNWLLEVILAGLTKGRRGSLI